MGLKAHGTGGNIESCNKDQSPLKSHMKTYYGRHFLNCKKNYHKMNMAVPSYPIPEMINIYLNCWPKRFYRLYLQTSQNSSMQLMILCNMMVRPYFWRQCIPVYGTWGNWTGAQIENSALPTSILSGGRY